MPLPSNQLRTESSISELSEEVVGLEDVVLRNCGVSEQAARMRI